MIFISQDRESFFCYGRGCGIAIEQQDDDDSVLIVGHNARDEFLLGEYDDKKIAKFVVNDMLEAIGDVGKYKMPTNEKVKALICKEKDDARGKKSLQELNLSIRTYNALARCNYRTIGAVSQESDEALLRIRNLGKKGVAEIREAIAAYYGGNAPTSTDGELERL